uniref:Uncharacterized protein n=1 Tax=Salix viminalis TaxID=40686 RepID=A0A6N2M113_SALVM
MGIMNSFINDIFEKLAQESSRLARNPSKRNLPLNFFLKNTEWLPRQRRSRLRKSQRWQKKPQRRRNQEQRRRYPKKERLTRRGRSQRRAWRPTRSISSKS